jgi:hypothetical protein
MLASIKNVLKIAISKRIRSNLFKAYLKNLRPIVHRGSNVHCPVCQKSFRKFLPAGAKTIERSGAECPKCTCKERHRLFWLYLHKKTSFFSTKARVLHFAPEPYFQEVFLKMENLEYISADLYSPLSMIKADITDIPFKDEYFDVIFCSHVLEHIPDDGKAMSELYRVLKQDGWAILQVPIDPDMEKTLEDPNIITSEDRIHFYWNANHLRLYGIDYKDRLEKAGFQVTVDDYVKSLPESDIRKYGLLKKENIYFCRKPAL